MAQKLTVLDLFSGAGGMSLGFHRNAGFRILGAVDAQLAKPSMGAGGLECNDTYAANIGLRPHEADLRRVEPDELRRAIGLRSRDGLDVLISCAPCTGFSRAQPKNHLVDDPRNSLVRRTGLFVRHFRPRVLLMENARELVNGRFAHHFAGLRDDLEKLGYTVSASVHFLNRFGLPQVRERALVLATANGVAHHTLDELWDGWMVRPEATHLRAAIADLPRVEAGQTDANDPMHRSPAFGSEVTLRRLRALPEDGGDWADLLTHPEADALMTPAMKAAALRGDFGSHPDVYGRAWWDRPMITIKRECSHVGNGRYSHPAQDRLLTLREMAVLQGFPRDVVFRGTLSNCYRHVGDAVPPLISHQLALLVQWCLGGERPEMRDVVMPLTHLRAEDIVASKDSVQDRLPFAQARA